MFPTTSPTDSPTNVLIPLIKAIDDPPLRDDADKCDLLNFSSSVCALSPFCRFVTLPNGSGRCITKVTAGCSAFDNDRNACLAAQCTPLGDGTCVRLPGNGRRDLQVTNDGSRPRYIIGSSVPSATFPVTDNDLSNRAFRVFTTDGPSSDEGTCRVFNNRRVEYERPSNAFSGNTTCTYDVCTIRQAGDPTGRQCSSATIFIRVDPPVAGIEDIGISEGEEPGK